jgi:hypothetical protein
MPSVNSYDSESETLAPATTAVQRGRRLGRVTNDIVKNEMPCLAALPGFMAMLLAVRFLLLLYLRYFEDNENGSTMHSMTERLYDYPSFEEIPGKVGCD